MTSSPLSPFMYPFCVSASLRLICLPDFVLLLPFIGIFFLFYLFSVFPSPSLSTWSQQSIFTPWRQWGHAKLCKKQAEGYGVSGSSCSRLAASHNSLRSSHKVFPAFYQRGDSVIGLFIISLQGLVSSWLLLFISEEEMFAALSVSGRKVN